MRPAVCRLASFCGLQKKLGDGCSVAGDLAVGSGPLATAEEEDSLFAIGAIEREIEELVDSRRLGDLNVRARACFDVAVAQRLHPAMPVGADEFFKIAALETLGPNGAANANVDKNRRLETTTGFDGVDGLDERGGGVAPPVIAKGEDGRHSAVDQRRVFRVELATFLCGRCMGKL